MTKDEARSAIVEILKNGKTAADQILATADVFLSLLYPVEEIAEPLETDEKGRLIDSSRSVEQELRQMAEWIPEYKNTETLRKIAAERILQPDLRAFFESLSSADRDKFLVLAAQGDNATIEKWLTTERPERR
jgi:hypothetical protein